MGGIRRERSVHGTASERPHRLCNRTPFPIMTRLTRTRNRNLNGLQNEIDRVFDRFFPSQDENEEDTSPQAVWRPRMDLTEAEDAYRLRLDMPGMSTDDLTISYKNDELVISGERESSRTDENEEFVRVERSFGHFRRAFTLPQTVDADNIEATYDNGVLTIRVPKTEAVKPRQIEIQ
ncbi:Hsp20/alpha crystallin family protein [Salinibacter ruber]|uniref:Hsp20/alpha crystallin family protein n=2 Tax=Salinibacter ruber TaxID=146919 RepID=UPI000E6C1361